MHPACRLSVESDCNANQESEDSTMRNFLKRRINRRGQGMTEYIIIVGLIAVGIITAVTAFKGQLNTAFTTSTDSIKNRVTTQIGK